VRSFAVGVRQETGWVSRLLPDLGGVWIDLFHGECANRIDSLRIDRGKGWPRDPLRE